MNNNCENMSSLQRAIEADEFFDFSYPTLTNGLAGYLDLDVHYNDAEVVEIMVKTRRTTTIVI